MIRNILSISLLVILFAACGSKSGDTQQTTSSDSTDAEAVADTMAAASEEESDIIPMAADELFDDFFFNFAANKKLQKSRIKFPLSEVDGQNIKQISASEWKMDYFFLRQDYYTLLFDNEQQMEDVKNTTVDHAIVEKIFLSAGKVKQYVFHRTKGAWMLQMIVNLPVEQSTNASFLQFYQRFATDEDYQVESLAEEVRFIGPDPDDDFSMMEGIITPDTWPAFAPKLPKKMIYNIIYGVPQKVSAQKIFVLRGIANGMEMDLFFQHRDGKWRLTKMTT